MEVYFPKNFRLVWWQSLNDSWHSPTITAETGNELLIATKPTTTLHYQLVYGLDKPASILIDSFRSTIDNSILTNRVPPEWLLAIRYFLIQPLAQNEKLLKKRCVQNDDNPSFARAVQLLQNSCRSGPKVLGQIWGLRLKIPKPCPV